MFSHDQVEPIWEAAERQVVAERQQYQVLYAAVETYLAKAGTDLIVGGSMAVNLLIGKPRGLDDYHYELYSQQSFLHATNLTNHLWQALQSPGREAGLSEKSVEPTSGSHLPTATNGDPLIVWMKTLVSYQKYQIWMNTRPLATIYQLPAVPPGAPSGAMLHVLLPEQVASFDKKTKLQVLPPEVNLLNVYRTLASPQLVDEWPTALTDENSLFHLLESRLGKLGAAEPQAPLTGDEREAIVLQLLARVVQNNDDVLLIGEHALQVIDPSIELRSSIVQIISSLTGDQLRPAVEAAIRAATSRNPPLAIQTRTLHVMQDFRLRRTIFRCGPEGDAREILYVYHATDYDLVPFNVVMASSQKTKTGDRIRIANPFVLMRFLLIEVWMVRWILLSGGRIDKNYAQTRIRSLLGKLVILRNLLSVQNQQSHVTTIDLQVGDERSTLRVFPDQSESYLGDYENEMLAQKSKSRDAQRYVDYYPDEHIRRTGALRRLDGRK